MPSFLEALEARLHLSTTPTATSRSDVSLDAGWKFQRVDKSAYASTTFDDSKWAAVDLPHTWNAQDGQDGGNNYYRAASWYRRHLSLGPSYTGKRLFIKFDGANAVTDLYINGTRVGKHAGGYAAFVFDVTNYLKPTGDNVLAVKVSNSEANDTAPLKGDFTQFGGIYRDVHLIALDRVHFNMRDHGSSGVFLKPTKVSALSARLSIDSEVSNDSSTARRVTVSANVLDAAGKHVRDLVSTVTVPAYTTSVVTQYTTVDKPHLWNGTADPYLYTVQMNVTDTASGGAGSRDSLTQPLGFRSFYIDPNLGFFLNGKPYDLHGVNFHQDRQDKGNAVSKADLLQDVSFVRDIGASVVRLSHYQHAQTTYDALDRDGIVAWSEIPFVETMSTSSWFSSNLKEQLSEMIRQNFNHPSIVFWGIFNEVYSSTETNALASDLNTLAKTEDPTRITTAASSAMDVKSINKHTDAIAFNKYLGWYNGSFKDFATWADNYHKTYPTRAVAVSEYGAGASVNQHDATGTRPDPNGSWHPEEYQSAFHESYWNMLKTRKFLWAKMVWNLFDFASDSRTDGPVPGRNDKGLVTYDRNTAKDAYWFYRANWNPRTTLYITSRRFTNRTTADVPVKIYSNCDSVQLKVNGKIIGTITAAAAPDRIFRWSSVKLAPGSNTIAVSGTRNGVTYTDAVIWTYTPPITTIVNSPTLQKLSTTKDRASSMLA